MVMMNTVVDTVRKMDIEQLKIVADEIKLRRTLLGNQLTRSLIVGDTVSFQGRGGVTEQGTVTKINRKTVIVKTVHNTWKVPASMLTPSWATA